MVCAAKTWSNRLRKPKNKHKKGNYIKAGICWYLNVLFCILRTNCYKVMNKLMLNAFYEAGNNVGTILVWVFVLLMTIEVIYVMAKYLGPKK
jgi:hypothetical protein